VVDRVLSERGTSVGQQPLILCKPLILQGHDDIRSKAGISRFARTVCLRRITWSAENARLSQTNNSAAEGNANR
jgi:hypothetical protein